MLHAFDYFTSLLRSLFTFVTQPPSVSSISRSQFMSTWGFVAIMSAQPSSQRSIQRRSPAPESGPPSNTVPSTSSYPPAQSEPWGVTTSNSGRSPTSRRPSVSWQSLFPSEFVELRAETPSSHPISYLNWRSELKLY